MEETQQAIALLTKHIYLTVTLIDFGRKERLSHHHKIFLSSFQITHRNEDHRRQIPANLFSH